MVLTTLESKFYTASLVTKLKMFCAIDFYPVHNDSFQDAHSAKECVLLVVSIKYNKA